MNSARQSPSSPGKRQCPLDSIQLRFERNSAAMLPPISSALGDASSRSESSLPIKGKKQQPLALHYKGAVGDFGDEETTTSLSDDDQNDETTSLQRNQKRYKKNVLTPGNSGAGSLISPGAVSAVSPASVTKCHATIAQRFSFGYPVTAAERRVLFSSMRMRPKNLANLTTTPLTNGSGLKNDSGGSGDSSSFTGTTHSCGSPVKSAPPVHDHSLESAPDISSPRGSISATSAQYIPPTSTPPPAQYRHYVLNRRRRHYFHSATTASSPASLVMANGQIVTSSAYVSESAMITVGADISDSGGETTTPRENSSETTPSTTLTPALSTSRSPCVQRYQKQYSFVGSCGSSSAPLTGGATMPACAFNAQTLRSLDSIQRFGAVLYSSVDESSGAGNRWQSQWDKMNDTFDLDSINEFGDLGGRYKK